MGVDPGLKIGEKVNLQKIREIFQCGSMGGMLPVNRTNVMVIIADHTLDFYHDKWKDGILYYTGTGKIGDQQLDGNPGYKNGKLYHSKTNGMQLHLFEILKKREYIYRGIVVLANQPYQEEQLDENGVKRKVWIFPLKLVEEELKLDLLDDQTIMTSLASVQDKDLPFHFSYNGKPKDKGKPVVIDKIEIYKRDRKISLNALAYARFECEIDRTHESFIRKNSNTNYTEPHHSVPMAFQNNFSVSLDVEENIVSLCSNCHNLLHYGRDYLFLLKRLYESSKNLLKKVGIDITFERLIQMYQ